ncbi:hypothetical protein PPYR_07766 [Photinus pyralis]|uniref:Lamina-associated polypeptide 2 alpha C-terminal domain-containing protein n=2 Tax=Photinus pyralis TaxID=7054 RepID=A0A5N4ARF9_PHOPY|nr:hypothetical protein PPYR_07766 [Photinus pyralis]
MEEDYEQLPLRNEDSWERSPTPSQGPSDPEVPVVDEPPLLPEILSLLGETSTESKLGDPVHSDVAVRWEKILRQGLETEVKNKLLSKYAPISNCSAASPPKLNPEVKGAVTEAALRRDERLVEKQKQLSACLSAMGKLLMIFLGKSEQTEESRKVLEVAGDTARLIADLQFAESQSRRILVGSGLNTKFKATIDDSPTDEWLFGGDLTERIRTAKSLERSSSDLKKTITKKAPGNFLNSQRPSTAKRPQKFHQKLDGRVLPHQRSNHHQTFRHKYQRQSEKPHTSSWTQASRQQRRQ